MATLAQVSKLIISIAPLYPNFHAPEGEAADAMYRAWHAMVGHLAADILAVAFRDAISSSKFFPTPADVLSSVARISSPARRTGAEAWGEVQQAIADNGYIRPPGELYGWGFDDKKIARLVKSFGWQYLCRSEDMMADRAHFIRAYEDMSDNELELLRELPAVTSKRAEIAASRIAEVTLALTAGQRQIESGK